MDGKVTHVQVEDLIDLQKIKLWQTLWVVKYLKITRFDSRDGVAPRNPIPMTRVSYCPLKRQRRNLP